MRLLLVALGAAVALAGCSDPTSHLDQAATQRAVGRAVAADVDPKVMATDCGGKIERKEGGTFTCTVTLKGVGDLPVEVRQIDDEGALDVSPQAAVIARSRITDELGASLEKRFGRDFEVRCSGASTQIRKPDSTSTCAAEDATSRREVTVTVTDPAGTLAFAVAPPR